MSLKFGIYLVEQRIISPEQFCGLVKIQQEAGASLPTVAIRKNMLTIKQVATILDQQELHPRRSFAQLAVEGDFLDRADAELLMLEQRNTTPNLRKLVVECGLLTDRQCSVLFQHYQRIGTRPIKIGQSRTNQTTQTPAAPTTPGTTTTQPTVTPNQVPVPRKATPRAPKFKQRPVIVSQYTSPAN